MRIFFVTNNYIPYSGGVVQSITATAQELRKQGHEVFIITLDFLGKKTDDPDYIIRVTCPIRFRYKNNYMAIPWRPTHAIKKLIEQYGPDVVHIHHPFLLGASALRAAQAYNIPCVFTYHTLYEEYAHYIPIPTVCTRPVIRPIVRAFCNKVNAIVVPSSYVQKYLLSQNIKTPLFVIPSPLRECFIHEKATVQKNKKIFELLLVTRFVPEKNVPFVFEVMRLLPNNFRLTLAGYGSDEKKLQTLAFDTLQFSSERVRFIHKPNQEQLLELYRTADLFIFPSTTDTQGIVLAESMSQGLPVIALDGPGQRDIIENGENGFIIAPISITCRLGTPYLESSKYCFPGHHSDSCYITDAQKTAEIIIKISADKKLYNHLVDGARKTAQHYSTNVIIQKLLQLYNSITDHR